MGRAAACAAGSVLSGGGAGWGDWSIGSDRSIVGDGVATQLQNIGGARISLADPAQLQRHHHNRGGTGPVGLVVIL